MQVLTTSLDYCRNCCYKVCPNHKQVEQVKLVSNRATGLQSRWKIHRQVMEVKQTTNKETETKQPLRCNHVEWKLLKIHQNI